jgi:hypothetical protein
MAVPCLTVVGGTRPDSVDRLAAVTGSYRAAKGHSKRQTTLDFCI